MCNTTNSCYLYLNIALPGRLFTINVLYVLVIQFMSANEVLLSWCLGACTATFHCYCAIKILHLYSNVIVYIVYSKCGCLATDSHDFKDTWCWVFFPLWMNMFYEPYRLSSLECPQGPSSSFTTQGRGEVCLFSLFLRTKQAYLLLDFHLCFW